MPGSQRQRMGVLRPNIRHRYCGLNWLFTPIISNGGAYPMADDYEILTMKEICDLLKVHPSTVYKLIKQGEIPAFRIGSEWRFRRDTILRLLSERSNVSYVK